MSRARYGLDRFGRALRRPYSLWWVLAVLAAVATTVVGINAAFAFGRAPTHPVQISVQGDNPWGITQQAINDSTRDPILAWRPLTLTVTNRYLTAREILDGQDMGGEILLSTQPDKLGTKNYDVDERFNGVAVNVELERAKEPRTELRYDILHAYERNLGLGHGPKAVLAAAREAAERIDAPNRNPVLWISLLSSGAALCALSLIMAVRWQLRWARRYRRLRAAQRQLARVVLDLEALEVTYATVPENKRPASYTEHFVRLNELSLDLARQEPAVVDGVFARGKALSAETESLLEKFEARAARLTVLSDSIMRAGSVHAELAGLSDTFDRLLRPLYDGVTELLTRVAQGSTPILPETQQTMLRADLDRLLAVARRGEPSQKLLARFGEAEAQLLADLREVHQHLRSYPHGRTQPIRLPDAALTTLRKSLKLPTRRHLDARFELAEINALTAAILGPHPSFDPPLSPRDADGKHPLAKLVARFTGGSARITRGVGITAGVLLLIGAIVPAGLGVDELTMRAKAPTSPVAELELRVDGPGQYLDLAALRKTLDRELPAGEHVTVAVRDAQSYLELEYRETDKVSGASPRSLLEAMGRIKAELPELLGPNKELKAGENIVPLFITSDGQGAVPGMISSVTNIGDWGFRSAVDWKYGSLYASKYREIQVANVLEDFADDLENNGFRDIGVSDGVLFFLLYVAIVCTVLAAVAVALVLGTLLLRWVSFGSSGPRLRAAERRLEELTGSLDESRLNAVAVLGAGEASAAAEAGQRLFERGLAMAWREVQDLRSAALSERLTAAYAAKVEHLAGVIAVLGARDADVTQRAEAFIDLGRREMR